MTNWSSKTQSYWQTDTSNSSMSIKD